MKKPRQDPAIREIDAKTQELMQEFLNHVRDCQALHPEDPDPRKIFEAWAIQKIAGLQYTVLHLADRLNALTQPIGKN
jgi:hypothetical protein